MEKINPRLSLKISKMSSQLKKLEEENHNHNWDKKNHYGMCGQSCPCCRAEIEDVPLGVCPICWRKKNSNSKR
jgi:hypothetical protein